jgi:hypothetical protein
MKGVAGQRCEAMTGLLDTVPVVGSIVMHRGRPLMGRNNRLTQEQCWSSRPLRRAPIQKPEDGARFIPH